MKAVKDKKKFGWNKPPKNRNCKKFGVQNGGPNKDRYGLSILLFHKEGWDNINDNRLKWVISDIKFYYSQYLKNIDLFKYYSRYRYDKDYWKTNDGIYYKTMFNHINELYNTCKLRGDI